MLERDVRVGGSTWQSPYNSSRPTFPERYYISLHAEACNGLLGTLQVYTRHLKPELVALGSSLSWSQGNYPDYPKDKHDRRKPETPKTADFLGHRTFLPSILFGLPSYRMKPISQMNIASASPTNANTSPMLNPLM